MKTSTLLLLLVWLIGSQLVAQNDSTINNLKLPNDYPIDENTLSINRYGSGEQQMLIIADLGFSDLAFKPFIQANENQYSFHVVTLPGSNGTPTYSLPKKGTSYAERTWLKKTITALNEYISNKDLKNIHVMGQVNISSWLAMELALSNTNIKKLIIAAGAPLATWPSRKFKGEPVKPEERKGNIDFYMAPVFYKNLTRKNWEEGLFASDLYASNKEMANVFWHQSASVPIPIMVQYLCEFFTDDMSTKYRKIKIPVLILKPDFKGESESSYTLFSNVWHKAESLDNFKIVEIKDSNIMMFYDALEETNKIINKRM